MKFRITLLALTLFTIPAVAQQAVQQSGSVTRGHVPYWVTSGVIGDGGSATNSPISSIGVTNNGGAGICISSDVQTAAGRNQLCFGASTAGAATISLQNYGAASAQNLNFVINGAVLQFPTSAIPLPVSSGGTGATTGSGAQVNLGLGTMAVQNANNVTITGGAITGLPTPVVAADAAIKSYVDALATGLNILASSTLATAAILPNSPTYANGAAGVGATLTAGSNTTLTVDGAAAPLNTVVLVKNQASAFQNGIYTVTTAGSGAAAWVLTRVSYFNTAAQMKAGSYTFITTGSVNANASYVLGATIVTVGTDALNFNQFSLSGGGVTNIGGVTGAITLGSGLTIGGSSLSTQYVPTGAGAVARPVQAKLGESVSIKDFGADSTGSADSLAAVNNAIASGALSIYAPAGFYKLSAQPSALANGQTVYGDGITNTVFQPTAASFSVWNCTGTLACTFKDFGVSFPSAASAGVYAIQIGATSGLNSKSNVQRVYTNNAFYGIEIGSAVYAVISDSWFAGTGSTASAGIYVNSTSDYTGGDNYIYGTTTSLTGASNCVLIAAGSGVNYTHNKCVGDNSVNSTGVQLQLAAGAPASGVSDFIIANNSIENKQFGTIWTRLNATSIVTNVQINGNEFETSAGGITNDFPADATGPWIKTVQINNNINFGPSGAATTYFAAVDTISNFSVSNNTNIFNGSGNGVFANIGTQATNGLIADNQIAGTGAITRYVGGTSSVVIKDSIGSTLALLPSAAGSGSQIFITDGAPASSPCTGASTGSMATRQNGAWKCF